MRKYIVILLCIGYNVTYCLELCKPCWPWDTSCLNEYWECTKRNTQKTVDFVSQKGQELLGTVKTGLGGIVITLTSPFKSQILHEQHAIKYNPYKETMANVRIGAHVGPEEAEYRKKRRMHIKKNLETLLGISIAEEHVPEIAISLSGGGFRALVGCLGAMTALQDTDILDGIMSISCLSGSSWLIAPWLSSEINSLHEYKDQIKQNLQNALIPRSDEDIKYILNAILTKLAFDQQIDLVDFYGGQLSNVLLAGNSVRDRIHISDQAKKISNGSVFLPIYTFQNAEYSGEKEFFELTPYEAGSRFLKTYVPTWALGRRFEKGISKDFASEQSVGYYMGLFGSAFATDFKQLYDEILHKIKIPFLSDVLKTLVYETGAGKVRGTWGELNNYVYDIDGNPLSHQATLKLADAGIGGMLNPVFATYREKTPDLIIIFDIAGVSVGGQIAVLQKYAQNYGFSFPQIKYSDQALRSNAVTVIRDASKPEIPTIIYMPRIKDQELITKYKDDTTFAPLINLISDFDVDKCAVSGYCKTTNLHYTPEQVDQLSALMEFNVKASSGIIKKAISDCIEQKKIADKKIKSVY